MEVQTMTNLNGDSVIIRDDVKCEIEVDLFKDIAMSPMSYSSENRQSPEESKQ
jgi:hypothetical protein